MSGLDVGLDVGADIGSEAHCPIPTRPQVSLHIVDNFLLLPFTSTFILQYSFRFDFFFEASQAQSPFVLIKSISNVFVGLSVQNMGAGVSPKVGFSVGLLVGFSVGLLVGFSVGLLVGTGVGDGVGPGVGDGVGPGVEEAVGVGVGP